MTENNQEESITIGQAIDDLEETADDIKAAIMAKGVTPSGGLNSYADAISQIGGVSLGSRNIGEIVTSTIPLEDAGLHLLDGSLLQYGSYSTFIDYMEELYNIPDEILPWRYTDGNSVEHVIYSSHLNSSYATWGLPLDAVLYNRDGSLYTGTEFTLELVSGEYGSSWNIVCWDNNECEYDKEEVSGELGPEYIPIYVSVNKPDVFCTEVQWQTSVTDYGVCGKFVYDSVNNTVRLPKVSANERYLIKSYSNGTDWYRIYSDGWCEQGGANTDDTNVLVTLLIPYLDTNYSVVATPASNNTKNSYYSAAVGSRTTTQFNISFSNGSTGNSQNYWVTRGYVDISDYKKSELYEYIVIATSVKTDIQVDIDEIATDLNGKADVDLTNVNNTGYIKMARASMPSDTYINLTLGANGSSYTALANGWVLLELWANATPNFLGLTVGSGCEMQHGNMPVNNYFSVYVPVKKNDIFYIYYYGATAQDSSAFRFYYAEGSKHEAS